MSFNSPVIFSTLSPALAAACFWNFFHLLDDCGGYFHETSGIGTARPVKSLLAAITEN
jgi:hypothetical protein